LKFFQSNAFFAGKEIVDISYLGNIVGLPIPETSKLGDTLTEGDITLQGYPKFFSKSIFRYYQ